MHSAGTEKIQRDILEMTSHSKRNCYCCLGVSITRRTQEFGASPWERARGCAVRGRPGGAGGGGR